MLLRIPRRGDGLIPEIPSVAAGWPVAATVAGVLALRLGMRAARTYPVLTRTSMGTFLRLFLGAGAAVAVALVLGVVLPEPAWRAILLAALFPLVMVGGCVCGAGAVSTLNEGVIFWRMGQVLARNEVDPLDDVGDMLEREGSLEDCLRDAPADAHWANTLQVALYALTAGLVLASPWVLLY